MPIVLNNNRVVAKYDGMIEQTTHYYPYGGTLTQSTNQGVQKYKYNGKEFDTMHGLDMYDYGARQQDPTVGMFTNMVPLCEKYYNISPYSYCAGNPIRYVDPDGRAIQVPAAIVGAIVGAVVSYGSQVVRNATTDGEFSLSCFTKNIDVADIAISAGEGALIAASGGTSLLAEAGISAASGALQGTVNFTVEDHFTTGGTDDIVRRCGNECCHQWGGKGGSVQVSKVHA